MGSQTYTQLEVDEMISEAKSKERAGTINYYEFFLLPALYEKWSQESIEVREAAVKNTLDNVNNVIIPVVIKTTTKELIEEIEANIFALDHEGKTIFMVVTGKKVYRFWQQLKQKRGV